MNVYEKIYSHSNTPNSVLRYIISRITTIIAFILNLVKKNLSCINFINRRFCNYCNFNKIEAKYYYVYVLKFCFNMLIFLKMLDKNQLSIF